MKALSLIGIFLWAFFDSLLCGLLKPVLWIAGILGLIVVVMTVGYYLWFAFVIITLVPIGIRWINKETK